MWTMGDGDEWSDLPPLSLDSDEVSSLQPQMPGVLPWAAIAALGTAWRGRGSELPDQLWGWRGSVPDLGQEDRGWELATQGMRRMSPENPPPTPFPNLP